MPETAKDPQQDAVSDEKRAAENHAPKAEHEPALIDDRAARARELARAHFRAGANCAESVLLAVPQALDRPDLAVPVSSMAAWSGGIAGEGCLCGALAAAIVLAGADAKALSRRGRYTKASALAKQVKEGFEVSYRSSCCRVVRKGLDLGTEECRRHCEGVTADTAQMIASRLEAGPAPDGIDQSPGGRVPEFLVRIVAGSLLGFELAWLLVGWTWLDMRANVGLAIPVGILAGLAWAAFGLIGRGRPHAGSEDRPGRRGRLRSACLAAVIVGALPFAWAVVFQPGATDVAAILCLQGLGLRNAVPLQTARWAFFILISSVALAGAASTVLAGAASADAGAASEPAGTPSDGTDK